MQDPFAICYIKNLLHHNCLHKTKTAESSLRLTLRFHAMLDSPPVNLRKPKVKVKFRLEHD